MFKSDYKWQHDYVRLATDTGFSFEKHKSDSFDKNRISSIDIDRVIEEKDFAAVENAIPFITKFILDQEQAQILDISFVKIFQLSQLAIQYLLYCKKYLDNSLMIVKEETKKIKEENKELNLFVEDLKIHISTLMKEIDEKVTFKCAQCNKIFSTEEFLQSHVKRRHSTTISESETDKLQMEIKELKGRLNSAEKMIHKEQNEVDTNIKEVEVKKIEDLQQKFEELRLQVQSELKILQNQHNFQERYEKWFEKMALQGGSSVANERGGGDLARRRESTTQTTQTDLEVGLQEKSATVVSKMEDKENIPEFGNSQKQITEFGTALETKVTSSLEKIENQMQSFWKKLNEMEMYKKKDRGSLDVRSKFPTYSVQSFSMESDDSENKDSMLNKKQELEKKAQIEREMKMNQQQNSFEKTGPKPIKPRTKFTVESLSLEDDKNPVLGVKQSSENEEIIQKEKIMSSVKLVENHKRNSLKKAQSVEQIEPVSKKVENDTSTSETLTSETEEEREEVTKSPLKPLPIPRKRINSTKKNADIIDEELFQHFKAEVEGIIEKRLQDFGVSPHWKGLPTRSFQRALEIVNHQANLMKKNHPNFDFISTQIEKNVSKKIEETKQKPKLVKSKPKKVNTRGKVPSPKIEIKNRKMYDTDDSESDNKPLHTLETLKQFSAPYSAVIEELKAVTSKIDPSDQSEKSSLKEEPVKNEDQTKGVLKSFPSVGSLTKKKVLFNLDTDIKKDGGSTTSVASSVFDNTPRKEDERKKDKEKDIEDLSDFDFSDM